MALLVLIVFCCRRRILRTGGRCPSFRPKAEAEVLEKKKKKQQKQDPSLLWLATMFFASAFGTALGYIVFRGLLHTQGMEIVAMFFGSLIGWRCSLLALMKGHSSSCSCSCSWSSSTEELEGISLWV